jgi:DNA-binding NtrC family response regulator
MHLRLILTANQRSLRYPLPPGEHILGSASAADLYLPHPTVSRRHARIVVKTEGATLEDLGSRNGSLVNRRQVHGAVALAAGYQVTFGAVSGVVEAVEPADLEAEVTFPLQALALSPPDASQGQERSSVSASSLEIFTLEHLPTLVDGWMAGASPIELAQEVGSRLFATFPLLKLEVAWVSDGKEAIWFSASSTEGQEESQRPVQAEQGGVRIQGTFFPPSTAQLYGGILETCAKLLALAQGRDAKAVQRSPRKEIPEAAQPPQPPTLDPYLEEVYRQAARIARGEISVLIQGESGTGKEILARYMHAMSGRPTEKFFALNCAALPRDLLEVELFGIDRAVATGVDARAGKFELADGGTLFLDEIGDMGPETQAKILRVLQEQEVFRLGSNRPLPARVRVLAATNRDVEQMVEAGSFRQDLYHRIASWVVELPPLRRRPADIANLAVHFLEQEARQRKIRIAGISRAAMDELLAHRWPGNVRELKSVMARASLFLDDGEMVESRHLWRTLRREMEQPRRSLKERIAQFEEQQIRRALETSRGDAAKAAIALGMSRATMYRRMKELGIQDHGDPD